MISFCMYSFRDYTNITLKVHYKISKIRLNPYPYSPYQKMLIDKIIFFRECGHTYKIISQYFLSAIILFLLGFLLSGWDPNEFGKYN